jgi:Ser-tRNA(Ala) deacylase AlaX
MKNLKLSCPVVLNWLEQGVLTEEQKINIFLDQENIDFLLEKESTTEVDFYKEKFNEVEEENESLEEQISEMENEKKDLEEKLKKEKIKVLELEKQLKLSFVQPDLKPSTIN